MLYTSGHFYEFLALRQNILNSRIKNIPAPWTDDQVLRTEKFCNIDREDDRGTKLLREKLWSRNDLPEKNKILLSFIYRFCVSSETILNVAEPDLDKTISKITAEDFNFSWSRSVPYHLPLILKIYREKESGAHEENLKWIVKRLYENRDIIFNFLGGNKNISHISATVQLADLFQPIFHKRFSFYMAQGLADLFFYTDYLDIHGPVFLGIGALKGLKKMNRDLSNDFYVTKLISEAPRAVLDMFPRGLYPITIEHGLCEYTKYCEYLSGDRNRKYYFAPGEKSKK